MSAIVILDCSYLIFRAWHSMKAENFVHNGIHTNAVYGFVVALKTIHKNLVDDFENISYIACFDTSCKNHERSKIQEDYKSQRPQLDERLKPQFNLVMDACKALEIPCIKHENYEADDIIATLAKKFSDKQVIIVSPDKDICQCITDNVWMYHPSKKTFTKPKDVYDKFGVYPSSMIDYQSIIGDKIDNVKGIPGVGPKSALLILNNISNREIVKDKKVQKLLEKYDNNMNIVNMNRKLVTLNNSITLEDITLKYFFVTYFKLDSWKAFCSIVNFRC